MVVSPFQRFVLRNIALARCLRLKAHLAFSLSATL
jgi:hypothetical protein